MNLFGGWGLGFGVWGQGFWVLGFGFWVLGLGSGCEDWGLEFWFWFCVPPVAESCIRFLPRDAVTEIQTSSLWYMCEIVKKGKQMCC